jgi:molybdopterin-containing oxidoreductase family membrane subunit
VLSILAILCKRIQLLIGGFQLPNIDYATVTTGPQLTGTGAAFSSIDKALIYFPSPLEFGVALGVLALGVCLLLLGLRVLPLRPKEG